MNDDNLDIPKRKRGRPRKYEGTTLPATVTVLTPKVVEIDGKVWTDSLEVAQQFDKNHRDVLRAIETLECSEDFGRRNFTPSNYLNQQGKLQKKVLMTRDGFFRLCMAFTGSKASHVKEQFIEAFNAMEDNIRRGVGFMEHILHSLNENIRLITDSQLEDRQLLVATSRVVATVQQDISTLKQDVGNVQDEVSWIKDQFPVFRKDMTLAQKRAHIDFVRYEFHGKCPILNILIVDKNGRIYENRKSLSHFDHYFNKGDRGFYCNWLISSEANKLKATGKLDPLEVDSIFRNYKTKLERFMKTIYNQPLLALGGDNASR